MNTTETRHAETLRITREKRYQAGQWVAACGGTEEPFTFNGTRYLYCWHTATREHAYINLDTDMPMPADWHPLSEMGR